MTESTVKRMVGNVKWFNNKAGYGFITIGENSENPTDVFVHYSNINVANSQYKYLVQGEYVEFTLSPLTTGKHEFQAENVTGIGGGSTLCERRRVSRVDVPDLPMDSAPRKDNGQKSMRRVPAANDGFVTVRKRPNRQKSV
jgi:cold shock CspA family protein